MNEPWYGSAEGILAVAFVVVVFGASIAALAIQWLVIFAIIGVIGAVVVACQAASRFAARRAGRIVGRVRRQLIP